MTVKECRRCKSTHLFVDRGLVNTRYRCLGCGKEWVEPAMKECLLCRATVPAEELDEQGRCEVCGLMLEKIKEG